jgi:glycosyltransferase involved in cell wall biosynthesis
MSYISVVVPTKDRLQHLKSAIPGFLEHPEVGEVVVVVDGCKDGTLDYVQDLAASDQRVRFVDNGRNRGLPYSRNKGIELARFEYIFTGEDDLELTDGFFATLLGHLRESGADIISGRNIFRAETETAADAIRRTNEITGDAVNRRSIAVHTGIAAPRDQEQPLLPAPMLGRAEIFREIRFDEGYRVNGWREESDFQLSAIERGYHLIYCPHAMTFNFMIANDRGGVHSAVGLRRVRWVIKNNWRFISKHRQVITAQFDIGSRYRYIAAFACRRVNDEVLTPLLIAGKRRAVSALGGLKTGSRREGNEGL